MNTKKVVFNKLFSKEAKEAQKLSKQRKISLSLVEKMEGYLDSMNDEIRDVKDVILESEKIIDAFNDIYLQMEETLASLRSFAQSSESYEIQVGDLIDQYSSAADELGINPEDNNVYSDLLDVYNNDLVIYKQEVEGLISELERYIK